MNMVNSCCVISAQNVEAVMKASDFFSKSTVIEFQGAKTKELSLKRRLTWIASINRKDWIPSKLSRVCTEHFLSGEFHMDNSI